MAGSPPPGAGPRPDAPGCRPNAGCLLWSVAGAVAALLAIIAAVIWLLGGEDPEGARFTGSPSPATPAAGTPAASPPPAATERWRVELADPAGGWPLAGTGGPELDYRETLLAGAGLAVEDLVGGQYDGSSDGLSIEFFGGTLVQPRTPAELEESAAGLLQAALVANSPNLTPVDDQVRDYDPGPLGGQLWCTSFEGGYASCGWLDEQTIGYAFVIGGTEADAAAVLVELRADTEVR